MANTARTAVPAAVRSAMPKNVMGEGYAFGCAWDGCSPCLEVTQRLPLTRASVAALAAVDLPQL